MDPDAERQFRDFVAARSAGLYRVACLLTRDHGQAEDLLQGVLAKVALRWHRIRQDPEAYARRALYHDQVSRWRRLSWGRETPAPVVPERADVRDRTADTDLRLALAAPRGPTRPRAARSACGPSTPRSGGTCPRRCCQAPSRPCPPTAPGCWLHARAMAGRPASASSR